MSEFILFALIGGGLFATLAGPVGSLILWNRWAFLGDAIAHAALSGLALAILFNIAPIIGISVAGLLIALFISRGGTSQQISSSTFLAIIAHGGLAIGLIIFYMQPNNSFNIMNFLIGDILTIQLNEIYALLAVAFITLALLIWRWRDLVAVTVDPDMASINGISVAKTRFILLVVMCLITAFAIKMVGVLLATSLFVLPASAARYVARTPKSMCIYASIIGVLSVIIGIGLSFVIDTPAGPTIVVAALCFFALSSMLNIINVRSHN